MLFEATDFVVIVCNSNKKHVYQATHFVYTIMYM
jgi:hypothetical protein